MSSSPAPAPAPAPETKQKSHKKTGCLILLLKWSFIAVGAAAVIYFLIHLPEKIEEMKKSLPPTTSVSISGDVSTGGHLVTVEETDLKTLLGELRDLKAEVANIRKQMEDMPSTVSAGMISRLVNGEQVDLPNKEKGEVFLLFTPEGDISLHWEKK